MRLHPTERTLLVVSSALAIVDAGLMWWKDIDANIDVFVFSIAFAIVFIGIGQVYRIWRPNEAISLTMHMLGFFTLYSLFCAVFNLVLLPRPAAPIDAFLVRIDAWFGYSWPEWCAWVANHPALNSMLRTVYGLTLAQLLITFVLLGFHSDRRRLHAAALTLVISSLAVISCWAIFPSGGASAYWTLAPDIDAIVRPTVDSRHGAELYRLYSEGVRDLSGLGTTGLIGFPSFHTVMGLTALVAAWPYRAFRWTLLFFGAFLFPSILIHGAHNLVDVAAGASITLVAWRISLRLFDAQERTGRARGTAPALGLARTAEGCISPRPP